MPSRSRDVLATFHPPVRPDLAARAAGWSIESVPALPDLAASVVLLRDGETGLETYLLHRHARMSFAASMVVFPGGRVDPADGGGPGVLRRCGVRETAEETGVRLDQRDLWDWAHWTTPEPEPRRYDTWFFVAGLPAGHLAADVSGETDHAAWTAPADALAACADGTIQLLPPTHSILLELEAVPSVRGVLDLARDRVVEPVLPRVLQVGASWGYDFGFGADD